MGVSLCKWIVEVHNEPDEETRVIVKLPTSLRTEKKKEIGKHLIMNMKQAESSICKRTPLTEKTF